MSVFKYLYGINTKRLKSESLNSSYLWHCYLGHISDKRVSKLHKFGDLRSLDYESCDTSNIVRETKDSKSPFKSKRRTCHRDISNDTFGCMCTNVVHIRGRIPYFIIFIDNHSSCGWYIWWNKESEKLKCSKNSDQK